MVKSVSDSRSNDREQIEFTARKIGKSKIRQAVFSAICYGKQQKKSVSKIVEITQLKRKVVLWEAKNFYNWGIFDQIESGNNPVYQKDNFLCQHATEILINAADEKKRSKIATKRNPSTSKFSSKVTISKIPKKLVNVNQIFVDDVDSFSKVKKIGSMPNVFRDESDVKKLIKKILGEKGKFPDWGGETSDLFTSLKIKKKRYSVAFALKGKSKKSLKKLYPKDMGKNGDQIYRMFTTPASVFIVQFVGQIDESVLSLMKQLSIVKSLTSNEPIFYGIIDGDDTSRLFAAYG